MDTLFISNLCRRFTAVAAGALMITALGVTPAHAVDSLGVFELDGNAVDSPVGGVNDWENINVPNLGGSAGNSIARTGVVVDPAGTTIFTTGGSKDNNDVSQWKHTSGSAPDKDEITNAYAAAYVASGDLIIVAGLDRLANNGSADAGFWFFQQKVAPLPNGTFGPGVHSIGDLLVVVEFTGGGVTATAKVFRWVGGKNGDSDSTTIPAPGSGDGPLQLAAAGGACNLPHGANDPCALSNTGVIQLYWPYAAKFPGTATTNQAPPGSFIEVGINVSELARQAGAAAPCITSFLAETRSSAEPSAQLKDFVAREFEVCGLDVTKVCAKGGPGNTGRNADDTAFVYNFSGTLDSSFGTLYDVDVLEGTTVIQTVASVPTTGANWGPFEFTTTTQIASNTVTARGATTPGGQKTVIADAFTASCPPISASPDLSIDKTCRACLTLSGGAVNVNVAAEGQVCNTGDIKLVNVTVTDEAIDDGGTPVDPTDDTFRLLRVIPIADLARAGQPGACQSYRDVYSPTIIRTTDPGTAVFKDRVTARAQTSLGFTVTPETAVDDCPLCPSSTDPGLLIPCPPLP